MLKLSVSSTWSDRLSCELFASARSCRLKAGDTLFRKGDRGDGCYRLDKGLLKVCLISPKGEERIIAFLHSGAIVGDLAVIDGLPRSASIDAVTDSELHFVSQVAFQHFARKHPEIYQHLAKILAARLRSADDIIASFAFLPMKARVARALLDLAEDLGEETNSGEILIPRMINQSDLAAMAGVARENTNRILSEWKRSNLVTKSSDSYWIADKARLEGEIKSA
jgi:CRP/FNR family transcriptional regulator, cyclic AMP receptor protein